MTMQTAGPSLLHVLKQAFEAHRKGNAEDAERLYKRVLRVAPTQFDALHLLGVLKAERGFQGEAERLIRKALAVNPRSAEALNNHANVLQSLRRYGEALASCDKALEIRPDYVEALNNRGNVLHDLHRHDEAMESYDRALAIRPDYAKALANRAEVLRDLNRFAEALASTDRALTIEPDLVEALNNRGIALHKLGPLGESLTCFDRALAIRPDYAKAHVNRARVLRELRRGEDAAASYERALGTRSSAVRSMQGEIFSEYLSLKRETCDWTEYSRDRGRLIEAIDTGSYSVLPFVVLDWLDDPARQYRAARRLIDSLKPEPRSVFPERARSDREKIRLGYLSPDFREHAVAHLTAELFELHDRDNFEIYAFSFGADDKSDLRKRLVRSFDRFIDLREVSDLRAARHVRELEIDVAVDLGGLTEGARPTILAYRPAPIQVNYLGYPGTMGADFIDYVIVDPIIASAKQEAQFCERLVHLPECYQMNDGKRPTSDRTPARSEVGLPENGFVFACFCNSVKLTPEVFDVWMRLLIAVPGSVLWLLGGYEATRRNLQREAAARGVGADRLVFAEHRPLAEHIARQPLADLFLDTAPYGAHVTASDALWAGLPVLTCAGRSFASRVAASLLHAVGLPELVTQTINDYEALALKLAGDPAMLEALRARLANKRSAVPLFDSARTCRNLERAYREMFARWTRGEPTRSFAVSDLPA
jgi:predicted O-linked N-acetylglucosamine transferase (SPINDLY family)